MDRQTNLNPETVAMLFKVCETFKIGGLFYSYEEIKNGNVNHTYKVNYIQDDGAGKANIKSYLVQKINTVAFNNPSELMSNIDKVTTYLREKNPDSRCLHFHHTLNGKNFFFDGNYYWRLSNYIPSKTYNNGNDIEIVRHSGEAFGAFQMMLGDFDPNQLYFTIKNFHNTRKRYESFKKSIKNDVYNRVSECKEEIEWLLSVEDTACKLTDLYNEGKLPLRVTHNDTKINNVLFDEKTNKPIVVIDLDTVMPGLVGHDFGDAIRFAANFADEDCENTSKIGLDLNTYWAFTEGFLSKTAKTLTETEIETLGISCFSLACELSTRFLADYLDGDIYFKVKKDKHNLIRSKAQIALAKDMLRKMDAMTAICRECSKKYQ